MKVLKLEKKDEGIINNLYHPTGKFKLESFDQIELFNCFTKKNGKFLPLVFKECFALLRKGGVFNIIYKSSLIGLTPQRIEEIFWWLFQGKYLILNDERKNNSYLLSIKKIESTIQKEEGIDFWTFGMVTNGVRKDFIYKSIESIRKLKIPHYEIIICGHYEGEKGNDIKYIPFTDRDDKGWITKKKNIIAENATYQNLVIFHDRIIFNKDWYISMKKYGNYFEVLTCRQTLENGQRVGDWLTTNVGYKDKGFMYKIEELDYRDWNMATYIAGQLIIMKRDIWKKIPWNETIYWGEGEDIEYSERLTEAGFIPRFNPYASCISLSWRFGILPSKLYSGTNSKLSHFFDDVPYRRIARLGMYYAIKAPFVEQLVKVTYPFIAKLSVYKYIREH